MKKTPTKFLKKRIRNIVTTHYLHLHFHLKSRGTNLPVYNYNQFNQSIKSLKKVNYIANMTTLKYFLKVIHVDASNVLDE